LFKHPSPTVNATDSLSGVLWHFKDDVPAKQPYLPAYIIPVQSLPQWISTITWNAKSSH